MAGKKGKGKKKKGKKSADGSRIAAALMPTAMFAAVPRTPPPPKEPVKLGMNVTSAVLGSSLISRFIGTPEPPGEERNLNETDTSLDDYQEVPYYEDSRYSTLEFREGPSGSSLDRRSGGRVPTPVRIDQPDYNSDLEPDMQRGTYELQRSSPEVPLYSTVERRSRRGRPGSDAIPDEYPPSATIERYIEEDIIATGGSHRSPPRTKSASPGPSSPRGRSPGSRTASPTSLEERLEDMMIEKVVVERKSSGLQSSAPPSLKLKLPSDDLLHTASPKLQALERQNQELIDQVREQTKLLQEHQQQMAHQEELQRQLLDKLRDQNLMETQRPEETIKEMRETLEITQSVNSETITRHNSLLLSMQERSKVMEREKRELQELNEQLQAEINSLRRMASMKDSGKLRVSFEGEDGPSDTQILLLKKQLQDSKDERDTLKAATQRLNVELSRYQAKYRPPANDQEEFGLPTRGPTPSWLINTKYLAPLFLAYDDRLEEKDSIIRHYEDEMDGFRERVEEILRENQRLHLRIEQTDISGPMSMTEWRQLQEQCKLVLEENQLLMEQLDVQQNKAKDMHKCHVQEVTKLAKKIVVLESEKSEVEQEVDELRRRSTDLKVKYDSVYYSSQSKVNVEDHVNAVHELKRSQEDEKHKLEHDIENMRTKIHTLSSERKSLGLQVEDLKAENKQLEEELRSVHKQQRKSHRKMVLQQRLLAEVESKEQSANHYLSNVVKLAEKATLERDTFAQTVQNQERKNKKTVSKLIVGAVEKEKMEEKMKVYKMRLAEKLQKATLRIKAQDEDFQAQRAEYEREIRHLRLLLNEKDEMMEMVTGEKKQVEDDLETMWQVATADNRKMQETTRKSVRKLKEHTNLNVIISQEEKDDEDKDSIMEMLDAEKS